MISKNDLLKAEEIFRSPNDELFVVMEDGEVAFRFSKEMVIWEKVAREYSWTVWNDAISGEEAAELVDEWTREHREIHQRLNRAIEFATQKHNGQFRKGTALPYILHPLEVLQILYSMRADTNVLIAGVLHDTVEDTNATLDEIRELFGDDVAQLVAANSEDKSKTWQERKQHTIDELKKADTRKKMLVMADKLSNLRSMAYDFRAMGDRLWSRFNAPKEKQAWYYDGILDALCDMQYVQECEKAYWELNALFKDVFVKFYIDRKNDIIYQVCVTGDAYFFDRSNLLWRKADVDLPDNLVDFDTGRPCYMKVNLALDNAELITRKEAEFIEDVWNNLD